MRRAAAIDKNQPDIVRVLRQAGAHVTITSQLKNAFDLVVVHGGRVFLVEVKDGSLAPSSRRLTEGEQECKKSIEQAGGVYHVITSTAEAKRMLTGHGLNPLYCVCPAPHNHHHNGDGILQCFDCFLPALIAQCFRGDVSFTINKNP